MIFPLNILGMSKLLMLTHHSPIKIKTYQSILRPLILKPKISIPHRYNSGSKTPNSIESQLLKKYDENSGYLDKDTGETIVHAIAKDPNVPAELLGNYVSKSNVNTVDNQGKTAAHYLAQTCHEGDVHTMVDKGEILRKCGAHFDIKDNHKQTPMDIIHKKIKDLQSKSKDTPALQWGEKLPDFVIKQEEARKKCIQCAQLWRVFWTE
jgi:hypothetical protein